MRLKHYISNNTIALVLVSLIIALLIMQSVASAYTITGSHVSQTRIFKCQPSTILANTTGAITSIDVILTNTQPVMIQGILQTPSERFTMLDNGGGQWSWIYGNDPAIVWGTKRISFEVNDGSGTFTNTTDDSIFVYSDSCTGANIGGYKNISSGLGNYTRKIYNGEVDFIGFMLLPWLQIFGYFFYIIIIGSICFMLYNKTQSVVQPIFVAILCFAALAVSSYVPPEIKTYVILFLALGIGAILYRLFKS